MIRSGNSIKVEQALIDNFVSMQKVLTKLSERFDQLSDRIDKLLEIFEISAKSLAEKGFDFEKSNKEANEKIDKILDQNKTIARSLTMLSENQKPFPRTREL